MTPTGFALGLRLIWIDGALAMTMLVVQWANVAGEEARQVLDEIDFKYLDKIFFVWDKIKFVHTEQVISVIFLKAKMDFLTMDKYDFVLKKSFVWA